MGTDNLSLSPIKENGIAMVVITLANAMAIKRKEMDKHRAKVQKSSKFHVYPRTAAYREAQLTIYVTTLLISDLFGETVLHEVQRRAEEIAATRA